MSYEAKYNNMLITDYDVSLQWFTFDPALMTFTVFTTVNDYGGIQEI